jgi:hypothetical protein
MNSNIQAVINSCEKLQLQVNTGDRHRITKDTISSGSLWLEVQSETYRLKLTGGVKTALESYVNLTAGAPTVEDQGNPVWHLPFTGLMEKIIHKLNKIQ